MRQLAWLSAPIDTKVKNAQPRNRFTMYGEEGANMPALYHTDYMANWMASELGPASSGGMGLLPLSFGDVVQWSQLTCTVVDPWESRAIIKASRAYVSEYEASKSPTRSAPNSDIVSNRAFIAKQMARVF